MEEQDDDGRDISHSSKDLIELKIEENVENPGESVLSEILADRDKWLTRSPATLPLSSLRLIQNRSDFTLVYTNPICMIVSKPSMVISALLAHFYFFFLC
jgi:hypothetical protein